MYLTVSTFILDYCFSFSSVLWSSNTLILSSTRHNKNEKYSILIIPYNEELFLPFLLILSENTLSNN